MSNSASFNNFYNNDQYSFGMNVKVSEKALQQTGKSIGRAASGLLTPLFKYLDDNAEVFKGDIEHEIRKGYAMNFNIAMALQNADDKPTGSSFNILG